MATRYSGELTIRVKWVDDKSGSRNPHGGHYETAIVYQGRVIMADYIKAPQHLTHAVDSPEAYDQTAGAALSFANDQESEIGEQAAYSRSTGAWYIARSKKHRHGGD